MTTVLVQINNPKAYKLLEDLQDLNILTVIKKEEEKKESFSQRFAGKLKLSDETSAKFPNYIQESRNEWEHRSI